MKGVWFDGVHSHRNLNLILTDVAIPPATPKTNYIKIPGADGSADLSEVFGRINYEDRECTFVFSVLPVDDFEQKKTEVSNLLNGKQCTILVDKDPEYFWDGRCSVSAYESNKRLHKITVKARVYPYKFKQAETVVRFEAGTDVSKILHNGRMVTIPTITATADASIMFGGNTYSVNAGIHTLPEIELQEGTNLVTVTSAETVEFRYREGDL